MKKTLIISIVIAVYCIMLTACKNEEPYYDTFSVKVQVTEGNTPIEEQGIEIRMTDSNGSVFKQMTGNDGTAHFFLPTGLYSASVSYSRVVNGKLHIINGMISNIAIPGKVGQPELLQLPVSKSESGTILIKELYVGGCQKDNGSGTFQRDKYVILYNNCGEHVTFANFCLAICTPFNAYGINNNYTENGALNYESEGFLPAASAIWYFPNGITFEPYQQIVIALNGAVNHTTTYSRSINFANADYYCTYDILNYNNTLFYPSPSELIPTEHYLKAMKYGDESEDAWPLSTTSPAFFIFSLTDETPTQFASDATNIWYDGGVIRASNICKRVPRNCILDAVEVYSTTSSYNEKRITADLDAGYVMHTPRQGHALVRKIDNEATVAAGHDIYIDTNNSSNDFIQTEKASLVD